MSSRLQWISPLIPCLTLTAAASAAVVSPPLVTAADVDEDQIIDPSGSSSIIAFANNSNAQSDLESLQGFGAVQAIPIEAADKSNIFNLAGPVDFMTTAMSATASSRSGTARPANVGFETSGGGFIVIEGDSGSTPSELFVIDFGTYDTDSDTFDSSPVVLAAAFTLTSSAGNWDEMSSVSAVFKNAAGQTLSTQDLSNPSSLGGGAVFFGYLSDGEGIGSIELSITYTSGNNGTAGLDDIGFAVVPEPGSFAMALIGGTLVSFRRKP